MLLISLALAQQPSGGPEIVARESDARIQLTVVGVGLDVTQTTRARLESALSKTHAFYESGLGVRYPDRVPLQLTVYDERAAFDVAREAAGLPAWAGGWFSTGSGRPEAHVWDHDDPVKMQEVFLHEASHWLMRYAGRTPTWLEEGLAQCFGHASVRGNLLTIETPSRFLEVLATEGAPSVRDLITAPNRWTELPSDQVGPLYVQGWALTAFLLSRPEGQDALAAVIASHRVSPTGARDLEALDGAWKGGVDGLQRDLERWLSARPRAVPIPRYQRVNAAPVSDGMWVTCGNGRLVSASIGCGG